MNTINDYIRKLDEIATNFDLYIGDIVFEHKGQLLSTVKLRLFQKSVDAKGMFLGEYKWAWYRDEKKKKGLPSNRVTLRHTGKFYNSMFVDYKDQSIIIDATDTKTSKLESMYGKNILALSEDELTLFTDTVLEPKLNNKIAELGDLDLGIV